MVLLISFSGGEERRNIPERVHRKKENHARE